MENREVMKSAGIQTALDGFLASIKSLMPRRLRSNLSRLRSALMGVRPGPLDAPGLRREPPWCSPNIWSEIRAAYAGCPRPVVFEYGCGASTLHHLRNLMAQGGTYIGVESDPAWYSTILAAISDECSFNGWQVQIDNDSAAPPAGRSINIDTRVVVGSPAGHDCVCDLRLRPESARMDGETAEQADAWRPYVEALRVPADVIIIDGRARKRCVRRVLDGGFLKPGGMVMLCEAGRGRENWLGRPTLTGEHDYQPEVRRILRSGGRLLDGCGVDRWPGLSVRRTPGREARRYPQEACLLVMPEEARG